MPTVRQQLHGLPQLLRIKPVMSWGLSALLLGFAVAYARVGASINLLHGGLAVALVVIAQGVVSHGLNDAYDWLTGTDKASIGKGTGGSRVIPEGKMSVEGVVAAAVVGILAMLGIGVYFIQQYGLPMFTLFLIALWAPVGYSVPPFKMGYRPFNELVIVLPALVGVVAGADLVLTGSISDLALGVGAMHAFFCISWFIISRIPDHDPDKAVGKTTTVVYVGLRNSRAVAWAYLTVGALLALYLTVTQSPIFAVAGPFYVAMVWFIGETDPFNATEASVTRLRNMHATTLHAVVVSALLVLVGVS